jgi:purine-nucleoside phosphorylase
MEGIDVSCRKEFLGAELAVVLGSGLGEVCKSWRVSAEVPFEKIPGLGPDIVEGHSGMVRKCEIDGTECVFLLGRKHHYEGRDVEILSLMNFLKEMGISFLLLSSAAGSLTHSITPGELVIVQDIIDFQFRRPFGLEESGRIRADIFSNTLERSAKSAHFERLSGERFAGSGIDRDFADLVEKAAFKARIPMRRGVLASVAGSAYETPAEVRVLQGAGADIVTMSCAPEVEWARRLDMKLSAVAAVTNMAAGITEAPLTHEHVLHAGGGMVTYLKSIILQLVRDMKGASS